MTDLEDGYTLSFTYENGRVSSVEESKGEETGARIEIQTTQDRGTVYRDTGADRISGTQDDILTYYAFDYAGRTVNAYTTDWKDHILGASNAVHSGSGTYPRHSWFSYASHTSTARTTSDREPM